MELKYKHIDQKIDKLIRSQTHTPRANTQFFPRVLNKTNISFTDDEMKLLTKDSNTTSITKTDIG
jgi:hypothetical protein